MVQCRMFYNKKYFGHTWHFQGCMGGLNQKRDALRDKLGMDVAPYMIHRMNTQNMGPPWGLDQAKIESKDQCQNR